MNHLAMTQTLYCVCCNFYFLCAAAFTLLGFTKQVRRQNPCLMKFVSEKERACNNNKKPHNPQILTSFIYIYIRILGHLPLKHDKMLTLITSFHQCMEKPCWTRV